MTNPRSRKVQDQREISWTRKQESAERLSGPMSKDTHRHWLKGAPTGHICVDLSFKKNNDGYGL